MNKEGRGGGPDWTTTSRFRLGQGSRELTFASALWKVENRSGVSRVGMQRRHNGGPTLRPSRRWGWGGARGGPASRFQQNARRLGSLNPFSH